MEPNSSLLPPQTLEKKRDSQPTEEQQLDLPKSLPIASISLSLSSLLSSPQLLLLSTPKSSPPTTLSSLPSNLKLPSQISHLSSLSLSSTTPTKPSSNPSKPSNLSLTPLLSPHSLLHRRPSDPSAGAAGRRTTVVWFRSDLRIHDNEALTSASNESLSILPVYLFDPRDYGKSTSGFDKTGPYRASFLLESVADLRRGLRARGSDLVVRIGRPETVLVELARAVGADAVYAHREVSHDEVTAEERVGKAMEEEGVEVKYFWGSTLYHIEDLPFDVDQMPSNYGGFREKVQGLGLRKTIEVLEQVKGLPARGDLEPGEIPSLLDLGLNPAPAMNQVCFIVEH